MEKDNLLSIKCDIFLDLFGIGYIDFEKGGLKNRCNVQAKLLWQIPDVLSAIGMV